jgi:hypothetical protein
MITHEIKKTRPSVVGQPHRALRHIRERITEVLANRNPPEHTALTHDPKLDREQGAGAQYMAKLGYTMWIEEEVRPKYPKGSLCTLRGLAYIPGHVPEPMYVVAEIQEVNWMAPIHPNYNEPACLWIQHITRKGVTGWWCPCGLRPLNVHELELIEKRKMEKDADARNKAAKKPAEVSGAVQGSEAFDDPSIDTADYAG